jgi:hypothetical protein
MKRFLIIGNGNAVTYKEIFPLIKDNQIWAGCKCFGGGMNMIQPEDTFDESKTKSFTINDKGEIIKNIMGVIWFTNLDHTKRHEPLDLYKKYNPEEYPKYDNYDAIEVSKVCEIPMEYDGIMGVPISFLDKYCPEQFEIIGIDRYVENNPNYGHRFNLNGKEVYARILIKSK